MIFPIIRLIIGERMAKRVFLHVGTEEVVLEKMSIYGIEKSDVPENLGGDRPVQMLKWMEDRKQLEISSFEDSQTPSEKDDCLSSDTAVATSDDDGALTA